MEGNQPYGDRPYGDTRLGLGPALTTMKAITFEFDVWNWGAPVICRGDLDFNVFNFGAPVVDSPSTSVAVSKRRRPAVF